MTTPSLDFTGQLSLTNPSVTLNGGQSSVIDSYLDSTSTATEGSRSSNILKLRKSYSINRESYHSGLVQAPKSLSQLRHDFLNRQSLARSLPSLSGGGSGLGSSHVIGSLGGSNSHITRRRRRKRTGLQPAPRTKAEKELLFDSQKGTIFLKHKPRGGLPRRKATTKGTHPAGFAGKRSAKAAKLYALQANSDADAIRAYHTLSASLIKEEQLSLSLMSFAEDDGSQQPINSGWYPPTTVDDVMLPFDLSTSVTNNGGSGGDGSMYDIDVNNNNNKKNNRHINNSNSSNHRSKQEHFHPSAFGMVLDDTGGDGNSDFGSDFGDQRNNSSILNTQDQKGRFKFLYLEPPHTSHSSTANEPRAWTSDERQNQDNQQQTTHPGSFCPATPLGRRLYKERKKQTSAIESSGSGSVNIGNNKKNTSMGFANISLQGSRSLTSWNVNGSSQKMMKPTLPNDTHGWGNGEAATTNKFGTDGRIEVSVVGAESLNAVTSKVLRAQVGGIESVILSNQMNSFAGERGLPLSPPRKGSLSSDGPVVLPSIVHYPRSDDDKQKSPEQLRQMERAESRSKKKETVPEVTTDRPISPRMDFGQPLGGWENEHDNNQYDTSRERSNSPSSSNSCTDRSRSDRSRSGHSRSGRSRSGRSRSGRSHRRYQDINDIYDDDDDLINSSRNNVNVFSREIGVTRKGCYLLTVRVLERNVPNRLPKDHPNAKRQKPLGKAPSESTTRTVQLNVKSEGTIVEIVSYVVSKLKLKSGLKWNCQYLDRQESKWKTLIRNHSAAVLASSEFHGVGSDGRIQIRLVAPDTPLSSNLSSNFSSIGSTSSKERGGGISGGNHKKPPIRLQKRPQRQSSSLQSIQKRKINVPSDRSVVTMVTSGLTTSNTATNNDGNSNITINHNQDDNDNNNVDKTKLKRFVMRSTPTRKVHRRNTGHETIRGSSTLYKSSSTAWGTPLFELEGWDNTSPTKYTNQRRYGDTWTDDVHLNDSVNDDDYATKMEDYSSPIKNDNNDDQKNEIYDSDNVVPQHNVVPQRFSQQRSKGSPIDHDITYANLNNYSNSGNIRIPYSLPSSHLLVDDEINNSLQHNKKKSKKRMRNNNHLSKNFIKLPYAAEPKLDKMNVLAKSIVKNFGVKKIRNNQFRARRNFLDEREARNALEKLKEEERKKKLKYGSQIDDEDKYVDGWEEEKEDSDDNDNEDGQKLMIEGEDNEVIQAENDQDGFKMNFNTELLLKLKL
jgi:hypothetical protein